MEKAKELLLSIIDALVENPDDVSVETSTDDMGVLLSLNVHLDDMGKVIGREGSTAKAIRTLLRAVGMRENARINLKILEPEGSTHQSSEARVESSDGEEFNEE